MRILEKIMKVMKKEEVYEKPLATNITNNRSKIPKQVHNSQSNINIEMNRKDSNSYALTIIKKIKE